MKRTRSINTVGIFNNTISILPIFLFMMFITFGCSKNDYSSNSIGGTPGANEVFVQSMSFSHGNKTVSVGTTIKWINKESMTHTVTSGIPGAPTGIFDSGNLGSNGTFSYTFNQVGSFKYFCKIHSSMTGTITVQ